MKFHYTTKKYLYTATNLTVLFCSLCTGFGQVTFQGLGHLPNSTESYVWGLSRDGKVVVGVGVNVNGGWEAFRWTAAGGLQGIGPGRARAVNADGSVIVGDILAPGSHNWLTDSHMAYRWTAAEGQVPIVKGSATETDESDATGVSADGTIVVGSYASDAGGSRAFRWAKVLPGAVHVQSLEGFSRSGDSIANAVNANGKVVVGFAFKADGKSEAFRWTPAGGMQGLGYLPGYVNGRADAVNAGGYVIVGTCNDANGTKNEAFRWTAARGMQGLGDLPGGDFNSAAYGVNDGGSIVVGYSTGIDGDKAVVWTSTGVMLSISTLLQAAGIDLTGWDLTNANGISSDGQVIVGEGTHNGKTEGWIITGRLLNLPRPQPLYSP